MTRGPDPATALDRVETLLSEAAGRAMDAVQDVKAYLASPEGQALRERIATGVIAAAPLLAQMPLVRRSLVGRALGSAAVAGIALRAAKALREWEPMPRVPAGGRAAFTGGAADPPPAPPAIP